MHGLRAPDPSWSLLRDDIADELSTWVGLLRMVASPDAFAEVSARIDVVWARWKDMADEAARAQRELNTPSVRRRGEATWLATIGCGCVILGLGSMQGHALFPRGAPDMRTIVAFLVIGLGVALVARSVIVLMRRPR